MPPYNIIIAQAEQIEKIVPITRKHFEGNKITWVYFGKSFTHLQVCRKQLIEHNEIDYFDQLQNIAIAVEPEYIAAIERLNETNKNNLFWWFSSPSTRCPYLHDYFIDLCHLRLIEDMHKKGKLPTIIVTESFNLATILDKELQKKGIQTLIPFEQEKGGGKTHNIKESGKKVANMIHLPFFYSTLLFVRSRMKYRQIMKNETKKSDPLIAPGKKILITTFFFPESLKEGKYDDRYFPTLFEYLRSHGFDPILYPRFPNQVDSSAIVTAMRNSADHFLIPEDNISVFDTIRAIYAGLRDRMQVQIDISPGDILHPLHEQIKGDMINTSIFSRIPSYLTYFSALRIFERCTDLHSVILWYENQYDDRAIACAMHRKKKNIPIIGYQGFIHYSYYFNIMPTQSEVDAGVSPDLVLVTGPAQNEYITRYSNLPTKRAAALRYSHVYTNLVHAQMFHPRECIIVLLPYEIDHACEILSAITTLVHSMPLPMLVKSHHAYPLTHYENHFGNSLEFTEYTGTVPELYALHPIVIEGTSSSSIETISYGIPTIFFMQKTTITLDPLPTGAPHYYRCYTPETLLDTIHRILKHKKDDLYEIEMFSKQVREENITPITPDTMKPFLYPDE